MKKNTKLLYIIIVLLLLLSCTEKTLITTNDVTFTVIHINDRHGRMDADPYISQIANELKARGESVLILDGGDTLHGQVTTNLTKGSSMVRLMNAVGYNAMVAGNHEFNFGVDRMQELAMEMDFPLLSANVTKYDEYIFQSSHILHIKGHKIGLFGITTPETPTASDPRKMEGLKFEDPRQTAYRMVNELQSLGCNYIIALTHLGDDASSRPENRVEAIAIPGVNLIIDGHSHTLLQNGKIIGNTTIVQAGEYGKNIGIAKVLLIDSGSVFTQVYTLEVNNYMTPDQSIISIINAENQATEELTQQVIGYTPFFLNAERPEIRQSDTNLSNLITDSMRHNIDADISFISGGSIRASIPAGDITMGHALNTMPFSNLIVTKSINGADIWAALEHGVSAYPNDAAFFLQFSGIKVSFDPNEAAGSRIVSVIMGNNLPLDINKTYTVAMLEFMAAGGDGYSMLAKDDEQIYYGGDVEAFVDYLTIDPIINETSDGRLVTIDN